MGYGDVNYTQAPKDLPPGKHFAIITYITITIPGDERSRTNPGHGYPEHTEVQCSIATFKTREAWEREITELKTRTWSGSNWVAAIIDVVNITVNTTITIG